MTLADALTLIVFLGLGFGAGYLHWSGLRHNVNAYLDGGRLALALLIHAGRFLVTIAVLVAAVQFGAIALLAALAGFLLSRLTVRKIGRNLARDDRT